MPHKFNADRRVLLNVRTAHLNGRLERYAGLAKPRSIVMPPDRDLMPIPA
jgi:hypothetical protein